MTVKLLRESGSGTLSKNGKRWKGILAVPGKGSSGVYSEQVLREYGPKALAPGAKAFVEHNPERPVRDMIGVYPEGARYEEGVGLVGELEVFPHWEEFIAAVAPHAGLSIYMMGESDDEGNVTALIEDRQNGVDLVSYPGLEGSGLVEKLYESAKKMAESNNGASTDDGRKPKVRNEMEISELATKVDAYKESVDALISKVDTLVESLKPVEPTEEVLDVAAVVEAVAEAALPKELRDEAVKAIIEGGADIKATIEGKQAIVESIRKQVEQSFEAAGATGRVVVTSENATSLIDLAGIKVGA